MKKLLAYAAPLALAVSGMAVVPTAAQAAPGGNSAVAQACNSGLAEQLGVSVGTCVNIFKDVDAHSICKVLKDLDLLDLVGARNQGQCIKNLR
ncbi:hypothetical protein MACH24_14330 [Erythrobacter sp. Dej080120_24]|uniref:hypothetical protein n=1 Tax=Erythrobacter sp. Dej080120_24 TaxID=3024837 RepID=UPI00292033D4|nr:hypothetical protein MACH24_14330 [Erythrobacter sp. Dej080120_24]